MPASFPGSVKSFGVDLVNGDYTDAAQINDLRSEVVAVESHLLSGGWLGDGNTWSWSSSDAPVFVISINADMTGVLYAGMRIRLTQTSVKYFLVVAVGAYAGGATLVTVYGGTDYTLVNAAIVTPGYSSAKAPAGFPLNPDKWSVTVTDVTNQSQASPVQNTWYNLGAVSITVPIGLWRMSYDVHGQLVITATQTSVDTTLSTANNTQSDADFTATTRFTAGSSAAWNIIGQTQRAKVLAMAVKTVYYLNTRTITVGGTTLYNRNDLAKAVLRAECAYL